MEADGAIATGAEPHAALRNVTTCVRRVEALRGVTVAFGRGELHAVAGPGGAGLSTLARLLAGAVRPDVGTVEVDGRAVSYRAPRDALDDGIALVPREWLVLSGRTVAENVFIGREPSWLLRRSRMETRYAALRERVGVDFGAGVVVDELRPPQLLELQVMRVLAHDVDLVVLDEPTAGMSTADAAKAHAFIRRLAALGTTVVLLSHALDDAIAVAETITLLVDGEIVLSAPRSGESVDSLAAVLAGHPIAVDVPPPAALAPDASTVLSVRGVRARPVELVSFDLRAGEILGIAGVVGSGRGELTRVVAGAMQASAGAVSVDGTSVRTTRDATRHGIVLAEGPSERKGRLSWRPGGSDAVALAALAKARPLEHSAGHLPDEVLSLLRPPRVLVTDEPTRGVPHPERQAVYELIQSVAGQGTAVLLGSSDARELALLAHRVLVLRDGHIVEEFDEPRTSAEAVTRAMHGGRG